MPNLNRTTVSHKSCSRCKEDLPAESFYKSNDGRKSGLTSMCKNCDRARKVYNPANRKRYMLRYLYGLSMETYTRMIDAQGGACAICKKVPRYFSVDHCHKTKRVRGLLCQPCNVAIGSLREEPKLFRAAIWYLRHHADTTTS